MMNRWSNLRTTTAFSLVEVTLALGVIGFGLVAILGVLPVAFSTSRASIAQTQAASIMETVFTGLRAQPFNRATIGAGLIYPEPDPAPSDPPAAFKVILGTRSSATADTLILFAVLNETEPTGTADARRMRFVANTDDMNELIRNSGGAASGYELTFRFNNQPDGMPITNMANRVTLSIRAANGAKSTATTAGAGDTYNFATVIANRGGN